MYEVTTAPRADIATQTTITTTDSLLAAEEAARHHQRRHPMETCFVWWHVTSKTRLLTRHYLNV